MCVCSLDSIDSSVVHMDHRKFSILWFSWRLKFCDTVFSLQLRRVSYFFKTGKSLCLSSLSCSDHLHLANSSTFLGSLNTAGRNVGEITLRMNNSRKALVNFRCICCHHDVLKEKMDNATIRNFPYPSETWLAFFGSSRRVSVLCRRYF